MKQYIKTFTFLQFFKFIGFIESKRKNSFSLSEIHERQSPGMYYFKN